MRWKWSVTARNQMRHRYLYLDVIHLAARSFHLWQDFTCDLPPDTNDQPRSYPRWQKKLARLLRSVHPTDSIHKWLHQEQKPSYVMRHTKTVHAMNECWQWLCHSSEIAALASVEEIAFLKQGFCTTHSDNGEAYVDMPHAIFAAFAVVGNAPCLSYVSDGLFRMDGFMLAVSRGNLHAVQSLYYASVDHPSLASFPFLNRKVHWSPALAPAEQVEEILPPILEWCIQRMRPAWSAQTHPVGVVNATIGLPPRTQTALCELIGLPSPAIEVSG